jgi:hypothetical protein
VAIPVPAELTARGSVRSAPPRRPGSVRRTTTMDFTWVDGMSSDVLLDGRARDLGTGGNGTVTELAVASLRMVTDAGRVIREVSAAPGLPALGALAGQSAMSGFRKRLAASGAADGIAGDPLYQLLDDVPGATLVSGAAWQLYYDMAEYKTLKAEVATRVMRDVCTGFQDGSSALNPNGTQRWDRARTPAVDIGEVDDELAWHWHASPAGVTMRRARRIDVWADGAALRVDAFFQDSSTLPAGGRTSIHEYTLTAEADRVTGAVRVVTPVPRVLPHGECPLAVTHVGALAGVPLADLRGAVPARLRGPLGCTHLNDMMRALADVPALARQLPGG